MIHPSRQAYVEDAVAEANGDGMLDLNNVPIDRNHTLDASGGQTASALIAQFDRKRFAQTIAVPTQDLQVRARLRELGEPITLFGEGPADRRDRLRELLTVQAEGRKDVQMEDVGEADEDEEEEQEVEEEYSTVGTQELLISRKVIARYSLPRAQKRVAMQKAESTIPLRTQIKYRKAVKDHLSGYELFGSQIASDRPIASAMFSPDGKLIASGSWSGTVKLSDIPNLDEKKLLRGHNEIVSGLSWAPSALDTSDESAQTTLQLASGGGEGNINFWTLGQDTPLATLSGHEGRVAKLEFHPSGKYIASASYDTTWRLWDVETRQELIVQEGHAGEVHAVSFNIDGSLLVSGGLDSVGRVWDLRTGKSVMFLDSHIAPIYSLEWGVDGHRILSGSGDGFIKCWDVRAVKETASIGGHIGGVTDIRWFRGGNAFTDPFALSRDEKNDYAPKKSGTFLISAGFDKTVKIFSADDWALCKTLEAHSGNVTGVDVSPDATWIASCGRDRTLKLWARDDMTGL